MTAASMSAPPTESANEKAFREHNERQLAGIREREPGARGRGAIEKLERHMRERTKGSR